ncbi:MAG: hypothetical protein R3362_04915 [Rhodothermales bacterium]|nr:hypothetical protein [Rhodothermales bacterium]
MAAFSIEQFARQLLVEALFYDEEYVALGNVSLIDAETQRERYLASFDPERDAYVIEEAVEWEDIDADEDGEIDYALAVDGTEYGNYETPEDAADQLLSLAREHNLSPSFMLLFEEDEA